jgi:hypothetical protein
MVKAQNSESIRVKWASMRSNLVRGVVFRTLDVQWKNGEVKNVFDWRMSVFRTDEGWG